MSKSRENFTVKIGYIGLGALGSELAGRFLPSHSLCVWDINPNAKQKFSALGADVASSAAEVGARSDVVFLCLPRSSDVQKLLSGKEGLAAGLTAGKIVVDQTSGLPTMTREIASGLSRIGVSMIDAAVSGSPTLVREGQATLMVSGQDDICHRVDPVLRAITQKLIRCGTRVGDAQAMKMINNAMYAACRLGTLEAMALGIKAGIPLSYMEEALRNSPGANQITDTALPALLKGVPSTKFALSLMLKDIDQASALGEQYNVPTPVTDTVGTLLRTGLNTLGPQAQLEDTILLAGQFSGTQIGETKGDGPDGQLSVRHSLDQAKITSIFEKIEGLLVVLGHLATYECASIGLSYGLALEDISRIINSSSGWSGASRAVLPALAAGAHPQQLPTLDSMLKLVRGACDLGAQYGAPLFLGTLAKALLTQSQRFLKREDDISAMLKFYTSTH